MPAFVRKVAIEISGLRRSGPFGGVCVNRQGQPRARNATARRDAARLSAAAFLNHASNDCLTCGGGLVKDPFLGAAYGYTTFTSE